MSFSLKPVLFPSKCRIMEIPEGRTNAAILATSSAKKWNPTWHKSYSMA